MLTLFCATCCGSFCFLTLLQDFDTYKYEVLTDNGVTIEQEHLLEQTNLNNMLGFDDGVDNSVVLKAERDDNSEVAYDILMEGEGPIYSIMSKNKSIS